MHPKIHSGIYLGKNFSLAYHPNKGFCDDFEEISDFVSDSHKHISIHPSQLFLKTCIDSEYSRRNEEKTELIEHTHHLPLIRKGSDIPSIPDSTIYHPASVLFRLFFNSSLKKHFPCGIKFDGKLYLLGDFGYDVNPSLNTKFNFDNFLSDTPYDKVKFPMKNKRTKNIKNLRERFVKFLSEEHEKVFLCEKISA